MTPRKSVRTLPKGGGASVVSDEIVDPALARSKGLYPFPLRRVTARVEVDVKMKVMAFFTNNLGWIARTAAGLCRARWAVELFFYGKDLREPPVVAHPVPSNEANLRALNPLPFELVQDLADTVKGDRHFHRGSGRIGLIGDGGRHRFPAVADADRETTHGICQLGARFDALLQRYAGLAGKLMIAVDLGHAGIVGLVSAQQMIGDRDVFRGRVGPKLEAREDRIHAFFRLGDKGETVRHAGHDRHERSAWIFHAEHRHGHEILCGALAVLLAESAQLAIGHHMVSLFTHSRDGEVRQHGQMIKPVRQLILLE